MWPFCNPKFFQAVTPFEPHQEKWVDCKCINTADPLDENLYGITTSYDERARGNFDDILVKNFRDLLRQYPKHPEAKSLGPDGLPCGPDTRGFLERVDVIADSHIGIGKESDRRWEAGDDLASDSFKVKKFTEPNGDKRKGCYLPSEKLIRNINKIGIRKLIQFGCSKKRVIQNLCQATCTQ